MQPVGAIDVIGRTRSNAAWCGETDDEPLLRGGTRCAAAL